eukprot:5179191-Prymnesium_polylepis.1
MRNEKGGENFDVVRPATHHGPKTRTNHLGVGINHSGKSRIKHARSITIIYESEPPEESSAYQREHLLREARKTFNLHTRALRSIFRSTIAALQQGQTMVGPRTFGAV